MIEQEQKDNVASEIFNISSSIAGTRKRYDTLLRDLKTSIRFKRDRRQLAESLSRRLKNKEGIIFTASIYKDLTGISPVEGEMLAFEKDLESFSLSIACIYHKSGDSTYESLFTIVHRDIDTAIEYKDKINRVLGVTEQKPIAQLVKSFIKINEFLYKQPITTDKIVNGCQLLEGNEVYCITMNIMMVYQIDPRQLKPMLENTGLFVLPLHKYVDPSVPEPYKEFEKLVGYLISPTLSGIEWGKEHLATVFQVCSTGEEDLLKQAKTVLSN